MASYQISKTLNQNCVTGQEDHLYPYLSKAMARAIKIDLNVSFLMVSGVKLILEDLKKAADKGLVIRILCSNYLNITQPEALYLLKSGLGDQLDLRFYKFTNKSFHAKAYFFTYSDYQEVFVGSSNLSKSALTTGIEWNYRINSKDQERDCQFFKKTFEDLWANFSIPLDDDELRKYAKQWVQPKLYQQVQADEEGIDLEKTDDLDARVAQDQAAFAIDRQALSPLIPFPQPIGPQVEALYALKNFRAEKLDRGLIVAATGERVIIVIGCINALISRVSGTFTQKIRALLRVIIYNCCKQCMNIKKLNLFKGYYI